MLPFVTAVLDVYRGPVHPEALQPLQPPQRVGRFSMASFALGTASTTDTLFAQTRMLWRPGVEDCPLLNHPPSPKGSPLGWGGVDGRPPHPIKAPHPIAGSLWD